MKNIIILIIVMSSLSGCSLFKATTVTRTETIIEIDTIIQVRLERDTITLREILTDTVKIESKTGTSIAFVDPIKNEIVLSFQPKTFDVPLVIKEKSVTTVKTKRPKILIYISLFVIGFVSGIMLEYKRRKR